jgi:hypothetical protein
MSKSMLQCLALLIFWAGCWTPNVGGSPECTAFCQRIEALDCGADCDVDKMCAIEPGECEASTRARLDCFVNGGESIFECNKAKKEFAVAGPCPSQAKTLCPAIE